MRLCKARIRKYRSIRDTGEFEIENGKTILVGPNEAGKTVILQALQQLHPPQGIEGFDPLRDYPRSEYNDITRGVADPAEVKVVEGHFRLDGSDLEGLPGSYNGCTYVYGRYLNNKACHRIDGGPSIPTYGSLSKELQRLCAHLDKRRKADDPAPTAALRKVVAGWSDVTLMDEEHAMALKVWLESVLPLIDEDNDKEEKRYDRLLQACKVSEEHAAA